MFEEIGGQAVWGGDRLGDPQDAAWEPACWLAEYAGLAGDVY